MGASTILVLDDGRHTLEALTDALEKAGYAPIGVTESDDPVAQFTALTPELVFLSLHAPAALAVCEQIRLTGDGAIVPIIFVGNGHREVRSPSEALAHGGDYHFGEPLDVGKVLAKVQTYVGSPAATAMSSTPTMKGKAAAGSSDWAVETRVTPVVPPPTVATAERPHAASVVELPKFEWGKGAQLQNPAAESSADLAEASDDLLAQIEAESRAKAEVTQREAALAEDEDREVTAVTDLATIEREAEELRRDGEQRAAEDDQRRRDAELEAQRQAEAEIAAIEAEATRRREADVQERLEDARKAAEAEAQRIIEEQRLTAEADAQRLIEESQRASEERRAAEADAQRHIEAERQATAEARKRAEEETAQLDVERQATAEARKRAEEETAQLDVERQATAEARKRAEEETAQLDVERQATADARRRVEEETARLDVERQAVAEAQRRAEEEAQRLGTERQAAAEAQRHAEEEAQRLDTERQAAAQARKQAEEEAQRRVEIERQATAEAHKRAEEETARLDAERKATEAETERLVAEQRRAAAEARKQAEEEAQRAVEAERQATAEARKRAEEETARLDTERKAAEAETERLVAEQRRAAAEARKRAEEETARFDAELKAAEAEGERLVAGQRQAAEDARRRASEEAARFDAERKVAEAEGERLVAEQRQAVEDARRRTAEEAARIDVERKAAEAEAERLVEQQRQAASEARRRAEEESRRMVDEQRQAAAEAQRRAEEESQRVIDEQRKATAEVRRRAEEEAARFDAERKVAEAETQRVAEERRKLAAEAEARRKAEEMERAAEEARRQLEEEVKRAEVERKAAEETRVQAVADDARRKADDVARRKFGFASAAAPADTTPAASTASSSSAGAASNGAAPSAGRADARVSFAIDDVRSSSAGARAAGANRSADLSRSSDPNRADGVSAGAFRTELPRGQRPPFKPPTPEEGSFGANADIADLFAEIARQQVTGRVDFVSGTRQKSLVLERGHPVDAYSSQVFDRMEEYLMREGRITRQQYNEVRVKGLRGPRRIGAYLTTEGYLKPDELFSAVRGHLEELVYSLFEWEEGAYSFVNEHVEDDDRVMLDKDPRALVVEGIRRKYLLPRALQKLGSPSSLLVRTDPEGRVDSEALGLSADERQIARLIDGSRNIEDIVFSSGLGALRVYHVLAALVATGFAEVAVRGIEGVNANGATDIDDIDRQRILDRVEQARQADYFQILGLPRSATTYEVDVAFDRITRDLAPGKISPSVRSTLRHELDEIERVLEDARDVLRDPRMREAYAKHLPA